MNKFHPPASFWNCKFAKFCVNEFWQQWSWKEYPCTNSANAENVVCKWSLVRLRFLILRPWVIRWLYCFAVFWSVIYHVVTWLWLYWGLVSFVSLQKITGNSGNTVYLTWNRSTWQFLSFGEQNYDIIFGNEERWVSHPPLPPPNIGRSYYM